MKRKIGLQQINISERTPGLFKAKFVGTRGVWLTAKYYLIPNKIGGINIVVKVFQRSMMICVFSPINMSWMFS